MTCAALLRSAAVLAGVALAATACGTSNPDPVANKGEAVGAGIGVPSVLSSASPGVAGPAAERLRAQLTDLYTAHVDAVAALARSVAPGTAGAGSGPDSTAAGALAANADRLAGLFRAVYGQAVAAGFLPIWTRHDTAEADYTRAEITHDADLKAVATQALASFDEEYGHFLEDTTNGTRTWQFVRDDFARHDQTMLAAIDAIVGRSPDAAAALARAERSIAAPAERLAAAIAVQLGDGLARVVPSAAPGGSSSPAASAAASLSSPPSPTASSLLSPVPAPTG